MMAPTPQLVQGIGGRMSGLVSTSPIADVVSRIERAGGHVLDRQTARLDQHAGVALACKLGYKKVAVTVALSSDCASIRAAFPSALIFAVHLTGIKSMRRSLQTVRTSYQAVPRDGVREVAGPRALLRAGRRYRLRDDAAGKRLMAEKIVMTKQRLLIRARAAILREQGPEAIGLKGAAGTRARRLTVSQTRSKGRRSLCTSPLCHGTPCRRRRLRALRGSRGRARSDSPASPS